MYICIICFIYYICKYIDRYRYILHYIYVYYIYRTLPRNFGQMMFQKNWEKYCKQVILRQHLMGIPDVAVIHKTLYEALMVDPPGGVQGQSPKSPNYLKAFKA